MYFMGMFEFRQYMNAADRLLQLTEEHEFIMKNAYADIHPTRVHFDYEQGKIFSESLNVADYAIWLIETKERQSKQRFFWEQRASIFEDVKSLLSKEERLLFEEVRSNVPGMGSKHRMVIEKLKKNLEEVLSHQSVKPTSVESVSLFEDVEEWDRKVEALSVAELFADYYAKDEVAL